MVVRNRTDGQPPDVARYEERSQVLAGERGDVRDHAIRTSYAFSIEGRRQILSTLGISSDESGRPLEAKLFSSNLRGEVEYNGSRYDDIWRIATRYTPGAGEGFAGRFSSTSRFLPGFISTNVWVEEISRTLFFLARSDGGFVQERTLGTTRTLLFPITDFNPYEYLLLQTTSIPDMTVGDTFAFRIAPGIGTETRPGDQISLLGVSALSFGLSTGGQPGATDSMFFGFARYLNRWLLAPTTLPSVLESPVTYVPFVNEDNRRIRTLMDEDTSTYDAGALAELQRLGIPFEYAYPTVRPVFGVAPEMIAERDFEIHMLSLYRQ